MFVYTKFLKGSVKKYVFKILLFFLTLTF